MPHFPLKTNARKLDGQEHLYFSIGYNLYLSVDCNVHLVYFTVFFVEQYVFSNNNLLYAFLLDLYK